MTRRISEADASQKIITGTKSLRIIIESAIKTVVIEEKQRSFKLVNSTSTVAPSFGILAKIYKQPVSSKPSNHEVWFWRTHASLAPSVLDSSQQIRLLSRIFISLQLHSRLLMAMCSKPSSFRTIFCEYCHSSSGVFLNTFWKKLRIAQHGRVCFSFSSCAFGMSVT